MPIHAVPLIQWTTATPAHGDPSAILTGLALILTSMGALATYLLWQLSESRAKREYAHELRAAWMQIDQVVLEAASQAQANSHARALFHLADDLLHGRHLAILGAAGSKPFQPAPGAGGTAGSPSPDEIRAMKRWFTFMVLNTFVSAVHALRDSPPADLNDRAIKSVLARLLEDAEARAIVEFGGYDPVFVEFCRQEDWLKPYAPGA